MRVQRNWALGSSICHRFGFLMGLDYYSATAILAQSTAKLCTKSQGMSSSLEFLKQGNPDARTTSHEVQETHLEDLGPLFDVMVACSRSHWHPIQLSLSSPTQGCSRMLKELAAPNSELASEHKNTKTQERDQEKSQQHHKCKHASSWTLRLGQSPTLSTVGGPTPQSTWSFY